MTPKFFTLETLQRLFPELQYLKVSSVARPTPRQVRALARHHISADKLDTATADALCAYFDFRRARHMATILQVGRLDFSGWKDAAQLSSKAASDAITALPAEGEAP